MKTLQLDLCRNLETRFTTRNNLPNITWAGVYNMSIAFDDERMLAVGGVRGKGRKQRRGRERREAWVWGGLLKFPCFFLLLSYLHHTNFYTAGKPPHVTGFDEMKPNYPDLNPIYDQFIIRPMKGEIVSEQVHLFQFKASLLLLSFASSYLFQYYVYVFLYDIINLFL